MAPLYLLIHAPVIGPASWRPVGRELAAAGHQVIVPDLTGFAETGPPYSACLPALLAERVPVASADRIVLVTHSGAGPFAAQFAAALPTPEIRHVFVDAGLPGPDGGGPVMDAGFLPYLRSIAVNGIVPPWDQWWPGEDLSPLFPDAGTGAAVLAEVRPLPLAFFEETLAPAPAAWPPGQASYLLFSTGYQDAAQQAADLGWPVTELPGEHLHMLADPAGVAAAITAYPFDA